MAYTGRQLKLLRSLYHSLRRQKDFFNEELARHRPLIPGPAFNALMVELGDLESELPGLIPKLDPRGAEFRHGDGGVSYRANTVLPYLSRIISLLEVELDEGSAPPVIETREFLFVKEQSVREIVERDYLEIQRAYIGGCWKSVVILAGSLIEAVLLDLIVTNQNQAIAASAAPKGSKDVSRWGLSDLIEVAIELKLINPSASKLSHSIREYRNLVHPGNEVRNRLSVAGEEARIAIEVLHIVHRDLSV